MYSGNTNISTSQPKLSKEIEIWKTTAVEIDCKKKMYLWSTNNIKLEVGDEIGLLYFQGSFLLKAFGFIM